MANDLWLDCAAWLTRCHIISTEHRVNHPESDIKVFATALRDGVLLCKLVDIFDSTAFERKDFNRKPQMAHFLCIQNIKLFLEALVTKFKIREPDLFEPTMLYDLSNFHRVLITLSKLSNCRKVKTLHNIPGFNLRCVEGEETGPNSDIYNGLAESASIPVEHGGQDEQDLKIKEVYQHVVELPTLNQTQNSSIKLEEREYIILEIVNTEEKYVQTLSSIKNIFMKPLKKLLKKHEMETIFPFMRHLLKMHKEFLARLQEAVSPTSELKLSTVFCEFSVRFLVYGDFCSCLPNAMEVLEALCRTSTVLNRAVWECEHKYSDNNFFLKDLLPIPMQRMVRYPLLLLRLVGETAPTHADFSDLERAKGVMKDVADYTNKSMADAEHLAVIEKAKRRIQNLTLPNANNLEDYGRLLVDGNLEMILYEEQTVQYWYAFLFEKIMILTENVASNGEILYYFRKTCDLLNCSITAVEPGSVPTISHDKSKYSLSLTQNAQVIFTVFMKTSEEREKWKRAIGTAIETLTPVGCKSTDHLYFIHTFPKPVFCQHCSKLLKGRIHQGYRCKNCEAIAHKGCVSSTGRCKQLQLSKSALCEQRLCQFNWYVGKMDREIAEELLMRRKIGAYLVRARPHGASHASETIYAISLKVNTNTINHMKIHKKKDATDNVYYLAARYFKTIIELITFYERNNLGENFSGLNHFLLWPVKEEIVICLFDFTPTEDNQLQLVQNQQVVVIGKEKDALGWWYGKSAMQIGLFPKSYVRTANADEI